MTSNLYAVIPVTIDVFPIHSIQVNPRCYKLGGHYILSPECYVIKVNESGEGNSTITEIQVCDADSNYYYVIYNGSLDIYKEDTVQIYGVPVGMTSFENVGGGTTVSLIIAGSYVHKTNE